MEVLHEPFEGFCEIALTETSHFIETEEEPSSFTVWFYKRDSEDTSLDEFLQQLQPNNFGWDEISHQFYFKSKNEELYLVNFTPV